MDKKKAISIITKAARAYHKNLEDQKVLFVYGTPSDVSKQLKNHATVIKGLSFYEVAFHRTNFLHLTGVTLNRETTKSSINFYEKCLAGRLSPEDFNISSNGSTEQKLDVLENMMDLKKAAVMIGDFTDKGPKLYSEKAAGNVFACIGFVRDRNKQLNVPNTLLKKDIRDVTAKPQQKIYAVLSKGYTDEKYQIVEKCDKAIELDQIESIEKYIVITTNACG